MKNKYILIIVATVLLTSCQKGEKLNKVKDSEILKSKLNLEGRTFFKVTETDSGRVLYKPCGANIEKYVIYNDSIFHNLGQEHYMLKISSKESLENQINYKLIYKYNLEIPQNADSLIKILPLDKTQKFWKVNNEIFIDSVFASSLSIIKELPCDEDCYDCPEKNDSKPNEKITGTWKTNCENGNASIQIEDGKAFLEIMFNQIYIDMVEIKQNNYENSITYKLKEKPQDLGSFGVKMDWGNFINDKPIAYVKVINDKTIYFYWYGFYNHKTKKREFTECEFQQESNDKYEDIHIVLVKCE
jgi:hypothetical protein